MRHVGMAVFGLFGVMIGLVALGAGIHLAFQAMSRMDGDGLLLALPVLLLGGAVVGGVLVAGRLSVAAPITGGVFLLVIAVTGAVFPNNVFSIDGVGMGAVTGGPLAVVLLLGAVVMRPSRGPAPVPGSGPYAAGPPRYGQTAFGPSPYGPGAYAPPAAYPPPGGHPSSPGRYPPPGTYPTGAFPGPPYGSGSGGGPPPGAVPPMQG